MRLKKQILSLTFLLLAVYASAYDAVGHRIVADIAYQNLTKNARLQADKVLGVHGMIYEATWADEIKSDKKYDYTYQWHYQNLADGMSLEDLKKLLANPESEGQHLFYAIDMFTARLKKDKNDEEALKLLVHFVGDLHQPMHLGRKDDLGGNKVETKWFGKPTNIHSVWDGSLIEYKKMSYSEYSKYLQDKFEPLKPEIKKYTLLQSVEAGYVVRNQIYGYDAADTNNFHYAYFFSPKLDELLYRGGIQLANILNAIYE